MKYIDEINAFHDWKQTNPVSASEYVLWHELMHLCNKVGWKQEFNVSLSLLAGLTGFSVSSLQRARNQLQQKGLITFRSRGGSQSAIYHLNSIAAMLRRDQQNEQQHEQQKRFVVHSDQQHEQQHEQQSDQQHEQQSEQQHEQQSEHIHKTRLDKTRLDKTGKDNPPLSPQGEDGVSRPFRKPTVEEIRGYCLERQNNIDPEEFWDFYESKGWFVGKNKMKDWKASVRTWERSSKPRYAQQDRKQEATNVVRRLAEKYAKEEGRDLPWDSWKP